MPARAKLDEDVAHLRASDPVLRGLIEETGTDAETGGLLYRTTELFLERLGLSSLEDLPPIAPLLPEVDAVDDVG